jgi:Na+-transporting NADH:ubiquinone oxidoreductase subunit NqrE
MSLLRGLVVLLGVAGLAAVILFLPRRVPVLNDIVHPYLLGNDAIALRFPISWPLLVVYVGVVAVVTGLLTFLLRGRR